MLTGEGADEMLAGYPHFRRDHAALHAIRRPDRGLRDCSTSCRRANRSSRGYCAARQEEPAPGLDMIAQRGRLDAVVLRVILHAAARSIRCSRTTIAVSK